jgi:N-acetylmuramoyl-L-alanine amidase
MTPIEINSDSPSSGGFGFMQGYGMSIDQIRLLDMQQDCINVIFVSLHCNAHETNQTLHGMQAYYCDDQYVAEDEAEGLAAQTSPSGHQIYTGRDNQRNQDLAQFVYDSAVAGVPQLGGTNAGKPVLAGNYAVLREHGLAGTLIEIGYMSNTDDLAILIDQKTQENLAAGIGSGIEKYFTSIFE